MRMCRSSVCNWTTAFAFFLGLALAACSDAGVGGDNPGGGNGNDDYGFADSAVFGGGDHDTVTPVGDVPIGGGPGGGQGDSSSDPDGVVVTEDGGSTGPGVGGKEFPSGELGIKIIGPASTDSVAVQNSVVSINGLVAGNAKTIDVTCSCGPSVQGSGSPFWGSAPLTLQQGDNDITVTATAPDGSTATDRIRVTYNPVFDFDGPPLARPASLWIGEQTTLFFTIPISLYPNFDPKSVDLVQVDILGNELANWAMSDDGDFQNSGDEVPQDGVFSTDLSVTHPVAETLYFRVRVKVIPADGGAPFNAWSDIVTVDAVNHLSLSECEDIKGTVASAQNAFDQAYLAGGAEAAQEAALAKLQASGTVLASGKSSTGAGAWAYFGNGVLAAVQGAEPGTRGGAVGGDGSGYTTVEQAASSQIPIQSRSVAVLSPFATAFSGLDETPGIAESLRSSSCPAFDVIEKQDAKADLGQFQHLNDHGISVIATHGDTLFRDLDPAIKERYRWEHEGSQEVLWTGQAVDCAALAQTKKTCDTKTPDACGPAGECIFTDASNAAASGYCVDHTQVDLKMGRVVIGGDGRYAVTPSFFTHHAVKKASPDSRVYVGACSSMWNGSLARELYGVGVKAIAGYSDTVSSSFAMDRGLDFFGNLIEQELEVGPATVSLEDPDHEGTFFRLFGASNLTVNESDIINADFEKGSPIGWQITGDGRVISQFGAALPVLGKFMGIISTGMGYTVQTGELRQRFCVPSAKTKFTFYWRYYSEEFLEWCGSPYQDAFQATLAGEQGQLAAVDVKLDDLCPANQCIGCGSMDVGVVPSDQSFDQGDVYNTQWQEAQLNISALAGQGPVTLKFFATDAGDAIYDTAILIDSIKFE